MWRSRNPYTYIYIYMRVFGLPPCGSAALPLLCCAGLVLCSYFAALLLLWGTKRSLFQVALAPWKHSFHQVGNLAAGLPPCGCAALLLWCYFAVPLWCFAPTLQLYCCFGVPKYRYCRGLWHHENIAFTSLVAQLLPCHLAAVLASVP